jgi:hypothetical protein
MFNDYIVKHDDFIKLTNSFSTIGEYRAINCCLNLLDTEDLLLEDLAYPVDITRYVSLSGLCYSRAYKEVVETLFNTTTLFKELVIDEDLKLVKVIWKPDIIPLISGIMPPKTFIKSSLLMDKVSSYKQYRLYEYLQKYLKVISLKGEVRLFTKDLREAADCLEVYATYKDFSRCIIKPTLGYIDKLLGISLEVKGSKREVIISKKII